jgi:hypothetical protein
MSASEAASISRACIQYVLAREDDAAALDFSKFRDRILTASLKSDDASVQQLLASPPFFIRTALRTLLASIRMEDGAKLEHALANLNMLLPEIWDSLTDPDKWSVGDAFAELSNDGTKPTAIAGLRKALMRVKGFDYVRENLRSNSFKRAAQAVLNAHHALNNYYNEPEPTRQLAAMGTIIPPPALAECIRAYLSVYLGNSWGHCWDAAATAKQELKKLPANRWEYYFINIFPGQEDILGKLTSSEPCGQWIKLICELKLADIDAPTGSVRKLLDASAHGQERQVMSHAMALLQAFSGARVRA